MNHPISSDDRDDIYEVRALGDRMAEAEAGGNFVFFSDVIAEDAVIMPPGNPAIEGRTACLEFIQRILQDVNTEFERHITLGSPEVVVRGDLAFDRGSFSQTLRPRTGGESITEAGKYVRVFTRNHDGWKVSRIIWNFTPLPEQDQQRDILSEVPVSHGHFLLESGYHTDVWLGLAERLRVATGDAGPSRLRAVAAGRVSALPEWISSGRSTR